MLPCRTASRLDIEGHRRGFLRDRRIEEAGRDRLLDREHTDPLARQRLSGEVDACDEAWLGCRQANSSVCGRTGGASAATPFPPMLAFDPSCLPGGSGPVW